ncbi:MAG: bifunctional (p)ppGpp synthetase/guanosine-3',5'-bis(diphosphate) 3'-pyrophosphohydrolase [Bacilli bacterium]|nr:bifunctional (p)ppGpp synthetase/guanosine-3',5'-bis(diphosphate) 3'-pyrophosphohydrolase [Bacilli bacterium]
MSSYSNLYNDLKFKILKYNPEALPMVEKAFKYAESLHEGQKRKSGEPYIIHPLNVTYILAELHADQDTLCAGLLHDTLEDTKATKEELKIEFNSEVAELVDGVTNISKMNFTNKVDEDNANARKILNSLKKDVRIIIVKLADRLHNMRTLEHMKPIKQIEKSIETLNIYSPLAYYIGAYDIKSELEDIAFSYLNPDKYLEIEEMKKRIKEDNALSLREMRENIQKLLDLSSENKIIGNEFYVKDYEFKNAYGIYQKLEQNKKINEIHDLIMLKVILERVSDCYGTIGLVHSQYKPINKHFKDYICSPKTNMYKSLHTTVLSPRGRPVQVQIRTANMDRVASNGITTYWDLKKGEARVVMQRELTEKLQFFKSLTQIDTMFEDNEEYISKVREEVFSDKIYVFTPRGDVIELPKGATPIDFAYAIHTRIGDNMIEAYVNDEKVNFDHELETNDRVYIKTDINSKGPDSSWHNICKTSKAKRFVLKNNIDISN